MLSLKIKTKNTVYSYLSHSNFNLNSDGFRSEFKIFDSISKFSIRYLEFSQSIFITASSPESLLPQYRQLRCNCLSHSLKESFSPVSLALPVHSDSTVLNVFTVPPISPGPPQWGEASMGGGGLLFQIRLSCTDSSDGLFYFSTYFRLHDRYNCIDL